MSSLGLRYLSERQSKEAQDMGHLAESLYRGSPPPKTKEPPSNSPQKPRNQGLIESFEIAAKRYKEERETRSLS